MWRDNSKAYSWKGSVNKASAVKIGRQAVFTSKEKGRLRSLGGLKTGVWDSAGMLHSKTKLYLFALYERQIFLGQPIDASFVDAS